MDAEALVLIDRALARFAGRDLVAAGEVADLLLDIRLAVMPTEQDQEVEVS